MTTSPGLDPSPDRIALVRYGRSRPGGADAARSRWALTVSGRSSGALPARRSGARSASGTSVVRRRNVQFAYVSDEGGVVR